MSERVSTKTLETERLNPALVHRYLYDARIHSVVFRLMEAQSPERVLLALSFLLTATPDAPAGTRNPETGDRIFPQCRATNQHGGWCCLLDAGHEGPHRHNLEWVDT